MKKLLALSLAILFVNLSGFGLIIDGGLLIGAKEISDKKVKDIYGNGTVYNPYLKLNLFKGLYIGIEYEGGYLKHSTIGIYDETASLSLSGVGLFIGYQYRMRAIEPYMQIGFGPVFYKQVIESSFVGDMKVDHTKWALSLNLGLNLFVYRGGYLSAKVRYVPLKVMPFEKEVDLSNINLMLGVGYRF